MNLNLEPGASKLQSDSLQTAQSPYNVKLDYRFLHLYSTNEWPGRASQANQYILPPHYMKFIFLSCYDIKRYVLYNSEAGSHLEVTHSII